MSLPNLSLPQILPAPVGDLDFNCCPDPDCPNFGVHANLNFGRFLGRGAPLRKKAALLSNSASAGLGAYKLDSQSPKELRRVSTDFEYAATPATWVDGREIRCQAARILGPCDAGLSLISNEHLLEEIVRLRGLNGVLDGPACGACGQHYLEAPDEFVLNGSNGKTVSRKGSTPKTLGIRIIHTPCKGKKGARFTVSLDHSRQKRSAENVQILQALVNGSGISDLVRMLSPAGTGRACGVSRVYDRIFWLEKVLLAFEREQLRRWKEETIASGKDVRHHLAHDDIALNINWETSEDRRITQLNCSVTADVKSGYVYRIDVDFDPRLDPISFFRASYLDASGRPIRLRQAYMEKSGRTFAHPLMSFQRPSGRLDEPQFFAAAASQLKVFSETKVARMPTETPQQAALQAAMQSDLDAQRAMIKRIHEGYFDLPDHERDRRAPFTGIMTRNLYTKAAHFVCLREMLPPGWITLVTEQESILPRVLPHIFHDDIIDDNFTWLAMSFDKEVKKPEMLARIAAYKKDFDAFIAAQVAAKALDPKTMSLSAQRRAYIADRMRTVYSTRMGPNTPYQNGSYRQGFMPQLWIASPVQSAGETNRVVGFPLLRSSLRAELKRFKFDEEIQDKALRARVAWRISAATLQPVSTFFNSLRERVSLATRAGGRSARMGPAFINGASFNPRVLIALLNIFRVHYNWFEPRQYVAPWTEGAGTSDVKPSLTTVRVPGSNEEIQVEKRRTRKPVHKTPAMRHGMQKERHDAKGRLMMPSLHRTLYRPWLFAGTPLWDKFEDEGVDLRRRASPVRQREKKPRTARVREMAKMA